MLRKNIVVSSSDPQQPSVTLSISGMVEKFVDIEPVYVRLNGVAGQPLVTPVSIVPQKKYPFKILNVAAMKGQDFLFTLHEKTFPEGNGWELLLENTKKESGRYHDVLSLQTDSDIQPVIKINVYGRIADPQTKTENVEASE